jgi:hypothetical protein
VIGYALGAALRNKVTLTGGIVNQSNFDSYEPLRISDMPSVEVHIVGSSEPPTGIGERGVPPVAPAVSNAIFAASAKRLYSLPWDFASLKGVQGISSALTGSVVRSSAKAPEPFALGPFCMLDCPEALSGRTLTTL